MTQEIVDVVVDMLTATDVKHDENDKLVRHKPGEGGEVGDMETAGSGMCPASSGTVSRHRLGVILTSLRQIC